MVYKTISIKEAMKRPEATGSRRHTVGPAEALGLTEGEAQVESGSTGKE